MMSLHLHQANTTNIYKLRANSWLFYFLVHWFILLVRDLCLWYINFSVRNKTALQPWLTSCLFLICSVATPSMHEMWNETKSVTAPSAVIESPNTRRYAENQIGTYEHCKIYRASLLRLSWMFIVNQTWTHWLTTPARLMTSSITYF